MYIFMFSNIKNVGHSLGIMLLSNLLTNTPCIRLFVAFSANYTTMFVSALFTQVSVYIIKL